MTKIWARPPNARSLQNEIFPFRTLVAAVRWDGAPTKATIVARPKATVTKTKRCISASLSVRSSYTAGGRGVPGRRVREPSKRHRLGLMANLMEKLRKWLGMGKKT